MGWLIGMDEAGYGPNLGPLVVSATVWHVPDGLEPETLYGRLASVVADGSGSPASGDGAAVVMADSKRLYTARQGLKRLETSLLAALGAVGRLPASWRRLWDELAPGCENQRRRIPWYADFDAPLPVEADAGQIARQAARLRDGLAASGLRLERITARPVFAQPFNSLLARYGNKAAVLSQTTLAMAAELIDGLPAGSVVVVCDKHGGRNRYAGLLAGHFPDRLIEIYGEGRSESVYRFGPAERRVEFRFKHQAERYLPVALASMSSKYLRELAMLAFNRFWQAHVPGLRPTAGYPNDAARFRSEIRVAQKRLGIPDQAVWRRR